MRISLLPKGILKNSNVIFLKHPRTNQDSPFLVTDTKIYELLDVDKNPSSFLISNRAISNGRLLTAAQIHPLFLALPLIAERDKELYSIDGYFDNTELKPIENMVKPYFPCVCDSMIVDQYLVWHFNEEKMLDWLSDRVSKLALYFHRIYPNETLCNCSAFSEKAFDIVRHYIRPNVASKLKIKLQKMEFASFSPVVSKPVQLKRNNSFQTKVQKVEEDTSKSTMRSKSTEFTNKNKEKSGLKTTKRGTNQTHKRKKSEPENNQRTLDFFYK